MLLLIDAGNTRIKWAVLDSIHASKLGEWVSMGSLSHRELDDTNLPWNSFQLQRVLVSNVSGNALSERLTRLFDEQKLAVKWLVSEHEKAGIKNHYRTPAQLGSDRFATLIAARALFPKQACIVATCGTALTVDAVTAQGDFIGGMIAPGLQLMVQSLTKNTAQLPTVSEDIVWPAYFADHTEAAMVSGCLVAQAGTIEHVVREFAITTKAEPRCIVSGGAAKYILPHLKISYNFVDNLVLTGLQVVSQTY